MRVPILIALCIVGVVTELGAETRYFSARALRASGPVFMKLQASTAWQAVSSGTILVEDSLLQVQAGGRMKVAYERRTDDKRQEFELTLTQPIVLRVTPRMLRRIKLSEVYLKKALAEQKAAEGESALPFNAAWQQLSAIYDRAVTKLDSLLSNDGSSAENSLARVSKAIEFLKPSDNQSVYIPNFPGQLDVTWQAPEESLEYEIFFWPYNEEKPESGIRTRSSSYSLDVYRRGRYLLKVQSVTDEYQSRAQLVNIVSDYDVLTGDSARENDSDAFAQVERPLKLLFPLENTRYLVKRASRTQRLSFSWRAHTPGISYRIEVENLGEKRPKLLVEAGEETYVDTELAAGSYRWRVLANSAKPTVSAWRSLKVEKSKSRVSAVRGFNMHDLGNTASLVWEP